MIELFEAELRAAAVGRSEPAWLVESRLAALRAWQAAPRPLPQAANQEDIWRAASLASLADSQAARRKTQAVLAESGIVFSGLAEALTSHPKLVERHLGSLVSGSQGSFAGLNSALWTGGVFVYAPAGAAPELPLQADLHGSDGGAFSRTLIIADEGSKLHYLEGCTAPRAPGGGLHAGVVEIVALPGASVRFTTLQDWPDDLQNVPTKHAIVHAGAALKWVDGNLGSKFTEKRPVIRLAGRGARAELLSCGAAGPGQTMALGGELIFEAPGCQGSVSCTSLAWGGGCLETVISAQGPAAQVSLSRQALLLDERSQETGQGGQAKLIRPQPDQLFFLMNLGLDEAGAKALLASGFCEAFAAEMPLEYSVEFARLLQARLEGVERAGPR